MLLFCHPVISNSLQPLVLYYTRPLCPSPSPEVCPSSCPLHQWCHPAISSSGALFSFCPQSFPASGTFPMSLLFSSDDQHTGVWASASVLPMDIQGWFPLRLTGLNPWLQGTLWSLLQYHSSNTSILWQSAFFMVQLSLSVGKESAYNAEDPGLIPGSERSTGEGIGYPFQYSWPSLAQLVKNPPAMQETWVWSLGWEYPLKKGMTTHSPILAGKFHGLCSPWGLKESYTIEWLSLSHNCVWPLGRP